MECSSALKTQTALGPNKHAIRVEVRADTEEGPQLIDCPTCLTPTVVYAGDLVGVVP